MNLKSSICHLSITCSAIAITATSSCNTSNVNTPLTANGTAQGANSASANQLLSQAKQLSSQGKTKQALKSYQKLANLYPLSENAAEARFQEASILYSSGEVLQSFNTYQDFIDKYTSSSLYSSAIQKQSEVAFGAASGEVKHNFMGLKSKLTGQTIVKMLTQVRDNAPFSENAIKAQYLIGAVWEDRGNVDRAILAYKEVQKRYPNSSLTPEALYKNGTILVAQSNKNNRNKANLDNARNTFQDLVQQFPKHKRARDAKAQLAKLSSTDLQRSYDIAEYYRAKEQNASAAFYYREVMRLSPSGALHEKSKHALAEIGQ